VSETSAQAWSAFFKDELREAFEIKKRLEERAEKVVAGNGTIVTLLFAIAAIVMSTDTAFQPSGWVLAFLGLALGGFALSAILASWVNRPRMYLAPDDEDLTVNVINDDDMWGQSTDAAVEAHRSIAEVRLAMIREAIVQNGKKADLLSGAITAAAAGISALSVALLIGIAQG
jgi:hypothetical protein